MEEDTELLRFDDEPTTPSDAQPALPEEFHATLKRLMGDLAALQRMAAGTTERNEDADFAQRRAASACPRCVPKRRRLLPRWLINNLLVITILWQALVVIVYRFGFGDSFATSDVPFGLGVAIMCAFQVVQIAFLVAVSAKLRKQLAHHTATNWVLVQAYLGTIIAFAGMYTVVERAHAGSFTGIVPPNASLSHDLVMARFLYFSTSVMTTAGFGDVVSVVWYADIVVMAQMLCSVLYTAILFSKGLEAFALAPPTASRRARHQ